MSENKRIIIDASALIEAGLSVLNLEGDLYTTPGVLNEIKDERTRRKLSYMPDLLRPRLPRTEYIKYVTHFASKLNEARNLSEVDLGLMALVCQYYEESGQKCKPLPEEQKRPVLVKVSNEKFNSKRHKLPGFYDEPHVEETSKSLSHLLSTCADQQVIECLDHLVQLVVVRVDDSEGWITPSNVKKFQKRKDKQSMTVRHPVSCLTTDFVMQNVLKQMGIPVFGVNGKTIKHVRRFCRYCIVCQRIVADDEKKCRTCGGDRPIQKIQVHAKPNGTTVYWQNKDFRIRGRSPPLQERTMKCCKPKREIERQTRKPVLDDLGFVEITTGKSRRQRQRF